MEGESPTLNNSSNICEMDKFINEKNCETFNKPVKCSMDSQQNFFNHLLNEIQFLREEVRMKNIIIKSLLLSKSSKPNEQNLAYKTTNDNFLDENILFNLIFVQKMTVPKEIHKAIMTDQIKLF